MIKNLRKKTSSSPWAWSWHTLRRPTSTICLHRTTCEWKKLQTSAASLQQISFPWSLQGHTNCRVTSKSDVVLDCIKLRGVSNLIGKETWEIYFTVTMNQILWDMCMSLWTHPCQQRWQAEQDRTCTGCMTSAGSPCNYGGWVTGPLGAPEWPVGADNKAESTLAAYLYVP